MALESPPVRAVPASASPEPATVLSLADAGADEVGDSLLVDFRGGETAEEVATSLASQFAFGLAREARASGSRSSATSRGPVVAQILAEVEGLPDAEVWRVRVFAGLARIAHEWRRRGQGFLELFADEQGPQSDVLGLLAAGSLGALGATCTRWRALPQWPEHWYTLGVKEFGTQRRLVPMGRFERFDEAMLSAEPASWPLRYRNFVRAAHCPSIEALRKAAVRVARLMDAETCSTEEVQRRLAAQLKLGDDFLSIDMVEQLLEDASSMRSVASGAGDDIGDGVDLF